MKKSIGLLLLLLICSTSHALDVPRLQHRVNDYAGMISAPTVRALEAQLAELEKTDSTQVVILTIPTLGGENLEAFSIKVAEAWRIGQKGLDNGAILLVAKQERKIRIEVGRGLEGKLTDLISGRIIRDEISPRFKAGDIDGGLSAGVRAIVSVVKGEYKTKSQGLTHGQKSASPLFALVIVLVIVCLMLGRLVGAIGGAVAGGAGLPGIVYLSGMGLSSLTLALLGIPGLLLGLLLAYLAASARFQGVRTSRGDVTGSGWFVGGGGFSSGGSDFSSGGSDFSGGGGDFGGGGASGDW